MEEGPTAQHSGEGLNDDAKKLYKMIDDVHKRGLRPNGLRGGPSGVDLWPRFTRGLISLH